jgi:hypothetical protein
VKTVWSLILCLVLLAMSGIALKLGIDARASRVAAALAAAESTPVHRTSRAPGPAAAADDLPAKRPAPRRVPPVGQNPFVDGSATGRFISFAEATDQVAAEIFDSCLDRPTLVVWLIDRTDSATELRRQVTTRMAKVYETLDAFQFGPPPTGDKAGGESSEPWLTSVVAGFGAEIQFATPEPTADRRQVVEAADSIIRDTDGRQQSFGAIAEAAQRFGPFASQQHRRLLIVVATDEAGDDDQRVDELVEALRKQAIAVFVIGVPAPFGSRESLAGIVQVEALHAVRQGPESLESEVLSLGGWQSNWKPIDSGFGPFALSRLALATGGRFLAVRPMAIYDPAIMAAYAPDYLSRAAYDALVQTNRARRALVEAARQPRIDLGGQFETEFHKRDEADLKRQLDAAQRFAARLEPKLQALYPAVEAGQSDAAQLVEPRWQAGYDLALGRLAAARARIEGYNAALAQLKAGRAFPDPSHSTWVLTPTDNVRGDSALEKLAEVARKALNRVKTQHPDTPWATQAARELAAPMGWEWKSW